MFGAVSALRLINLGKRNDEIASVCKVLSETEEEVIEEAEGVETPIVNAEEQSDTEIRTETEEQTEEQTEE